MTERQCFLHVGLPRTATTIMQREVFPNLPDATYIGKTWDNSVLQSEFKPLEIIAEGLPRLGVDAVATRQLREVLPSVLKHLKGANQFRQIDKAQALVGIFARCLQAFRQGIPATNLLYSDESLIESVAGLSSNQRHGATVPLEQLAGANVLQNWTVLVVLRDPFEYLRASWYKNNEFQYQYQLPPYSFDTWVRKQAALCIRKPSASRIFWAMQRSFVGHLRSYCPKLVISHYEALEVSTDLMAVLTAGKLSSPCVSLKGLPRENESFRKQQAVDFMLSAPGVPKGIGMKDYVQTFEGVLRHYELFDLLQSERLMPSHKP